MGSHKVDAAAIEFKPGKGLSVKSEDGDFELTTRLRTQWLYTLKDNHKADTTTDSLEVRRLRLTFEGSVFGKHNRYKIEFGFGAHENETSSTDPSRSTKGGVFATSPILDAYAEFDYLRDATLRIGQYKTFGRQRVMSEGNLQLVDVSEVTKEFTFERDVGIDVRSKDFLGTGMLHYVLGLYTGQGRNSYTPSKFAMTYLARVEALPLGAFEDTQEADFERAGPHLSIGATALHQTEAPRDKGSVGAVPADGGSTDFNTFSGDLLFKVAGLSASTEIFYRHGDRNPGPLAGTTPVGGTAITTAASRDGIGWYGQAGYLIPGVPFEIVARYGLIRGGGGGQKAPHTNELGGGLFLHLPPPPVKGGGPLPLFLPQARSAKARTPGLMV